ncbi:MAG: carboxypeptidase-like regulatory domain-containing protein, partial [Bacteroidota bacterium]
MKRLLLFLILGLFSTAVFAQQMISGKVVDAETKEPLIGANLTQKGAEGTATDLDGKFIMKVLYETDNNINISFVGYQSQEMRFSAGQKDLVVELKASIELNEIVVTALGLERSSKDLGYAIQGLDSEEISAIKSPNFIDNLAGKLAGVTISQGATGVGSTSKITIRGEASFTNNNPLFVVDGTPINNNSILNFTNEAAAGFQEVDFGNGAMEVNADDIASVSVLKGPSAAALYGTRASNGVIIITTKDGSKKEGLGISFNSSTFLEQAFQLPEFQNLYGQGNSGQFEFVDGLGAGTNDNITYSWGPRLDQGILIPQFDSPVALADGRTVRGGDVAVHGGSPITPTAFNSNPDNLKNFYETGVTTINNVALSSGFAGGNYRLSFTDLRSKSIIPGVNLDRKTVAARLKFQPLDRLNITTSFNYVNSNSDNRPSNGYGSENINYSLVAWGPRSLNIDNLRDYWQPGLEDVQQYAFNYTFFDNPYFILLENRNSFNRDRLFGNVAAQYDITDELSVTLRTGMDYSNELRAFRRAFSTNRFRNGAYAEHNVLFSLKNT